MTGNRENDGDNRKDGHGVTFNVSAEQREALYRAASLVGISQSGAARHAIQYYIENVGGTLLDKPVDGGNKNVSFNTTFATAAEFKEFAWQLNLAQSDAFRRAIAHYIENIFDIEIYFHKKDINELLEWRRYFDKKNS